MGQQRGAACPGVMLGLSVGDAWPAQLEHQGGLEATSSEERLLKTAWGQVLDPTLGLFSSWRPWLMALPL